MKEREKEKQLSSLETISYFSASSIFLYLELNLCYAKGLSLFLTYPFTWW